MTFPRGTGKASLGNSLTVGQLELSSTFTIGVVLRFLGESQIGKVRRADEGEDLLLLLVSVVILELGVRAPEVGIVGKRGLLRLRAIGNPCKMDHKLALVEVLTKKLRDAAPASSKTLPLGVDFASRAFKRLMQNVASALEVIACRTEEDRGSVHANPLQ